AARDKPRTGPPGPIPGAGPAQRRSLAPSHNKKPMMRKRFMSPPSVRPNMNNSSYLRRRQPGRSGRAGGESISLLKVSVDVDDQMRGSGGLIQMDRQIGRRAERDDR